MNIRIFRAADRSSCSVLVLLVVLAALLLPGPRQVQAGPATHMVNAFSVKKLPDGYPVQERFFASFRNMGIDTVVLELPLTADGYPDVDMVPNAVYLAHQAGLRLMLVLPTRGISGPLSEHDDWEDRAYDLNDDGYRGTKKLDLFNTGATNYLAGLAKDLALFSVDGLILGADFSYAPLEGMSRTAQKFASIKLDADIEPSGMYKKLGKGPSGRYIQEYSDLFLKWAGVKRDRLTAVYDAIRTAARKGNSAITVGVTLPVDYPLLTPVQLLQLFAFDAEAYRRREADHFMAWINYRELQERRSLSYRQSAEAASRLAQSVILTVKDARRAIIVLPMTEQLTGKPLRFNEIEEINVLVKAAGETGIAYVVKTDTELRPEFINKLFRRP